MSEITRNQAIQIVEDIRTAISAGSVTNTLEARVMEYCVVVLGRRIEETGQSGYIENLPDIVAFLAGFSSPTTLRVLLNAITEKIPAEASRDNKLADKAFVKDLTDALQTAVDTINGKIPAEASDSNKLADKAFVKDLTDALQTAVDTINANIGNGYVYAGIATPSGTPVSGKVFYLARQAGQYTNFGGLTVTEGINILKRNGSAWTQEQLVSMADIRKNPLIGYYECDTAGDTAAKAVTAAGYVLPATGGSVKIKMANRNTVANATLNINSTGAKPLYYNGQRAGVGNTWNTNEIIEVFYDGANYQAYNVAGSNGDGVFDISAYNLTDGKPTPYEDLEAALGPDGNHVPLSLHKGGMSIKFIQGSAYSSDNKYVQYRLMATSFSTTVSDWQGVDDEPTAGSESLVKSGGTALLRSIIPFADMAFSIEIKNAAPLSTVIGSKQDYILRAYKVNAGDIIRLTKTSGYVYVGITENVPEMGSSITMYSAQNEYDINHFHINTSGYLCLSKIDWNDCKVEKISECNNIESIIGWQKDKDVALNQLSSKLINVSFYDSYIGLSPSTSSINPQSGRSMRVIPISAGEELHILSTLESGTKYAWTGKASTIYAGYNIPIESYEAYNINEIKEKVVKFDEDAVFCIALKESDWQYISIKKKSLVRNVVDYVDLETKGSLVANGTKENLRADSSSITAASGYLMKYYGVKAGRKYMLNVSQNATGYVFCGFTAIVPQLNTAVTGYRAYLTSVSSNIITCAADGYLCISMNNTSWDGAELYDIDASIEFNEKVNSTNIENVTETLYQKYKKTPLLILKGMRPEGTALVENTNYTLYILKYEKGDNVEIKYSGASDAYCYTGFSQDLVGITEPISDYLAYNMNSVPRKVLTFNESGYLYASVPQTAVSNVAFGQIFYSNENEMSQRMASLSIENDELSDQNKLLTSITDALAEVPVSETHDVNEITLVDSSKKYLLLSLHKRNRANGMGVDSDAYLPNARKDFSDVRIYDASGNTLGYKVLYKGNLDLVHEEVLDHLGCKILMDSNDVWYSVYNGRVSKSTDGGATWTVLNSFVDNLGWGSVLCLITDNDTILFGHSGVVYRTAAPYTTVEEVLDENDYYANSSVTENSIAKDSLGNLYLGHYQIEKDIRIQKSVDDGQTWTTIYHDDSGKYQHVHRMAVDPSNNNIYAGVDGGGGVLKSTDHGSTWTDLRTLHPDMPQATDFGVVYFGDDYRLLSGETAIVGGHSLIKTTDDINFYPVLSICNGIYKIFKFGNVLFAGQMSSTWNRQASMLMSEDDGETWKQIYLSGFYNDGGANDGYRHVSKVSYNGTDYLMCIKQGGSYKGLRGYIGGENYYAQVVVDIPDGCSKIYVADGYLSAKYKEVFNKEESQNQELSVPLNDRSILTSYVLNGTEYNIECAGLYEENGRPLGHIHPVLVSPKDRETLLIQRSQDAVTCDIDLSGGNFHIGFWVDRKITTYDSKLQIIKKGAKYLGIWTSPTEFGNILLSDNSGKAFTKMWIRKSYGKEMFRTDINVDSNGIVTTYINGEVTESLTPQQNLLDFLSDMTSGISFLYNDGSQPIAIQHFEISSGTITQAQAKLLYTGRLTENV